MKKLILFLLFTTTLLAQNPTKNAAGFYAGSGTMNASAIGQFDSTNKGFLFPRMTTTQRNAISSPTTSLVIFNTTTGEYNYWNGSAWTTFGGGGVASVTGTAVTGTSTNPIVNVPTLQEVTDAGATTDRDILVNSIGGNSDFLEIKDASGVVQWFFDAASFSANFDKNNLTADRYISMPDGNGFLDLTEIVTSNKIASNQVGYTANGTLTFTDPTPETNKGYVVHVIGGTSTIGGVGYTTGALVYRFYNGSSWLSKDYGTGGSSSWGGITGTLSSQTDLQSALDLKANLASPTLTGTPNAPTQASNDNTTKIATTAYADAKVQNSLSASTTIAPSATAVNTALTNITSLTSPAQTQIDNTFFKKLIYEKYGWFLPTGIQSSSTFFDGSFSASATTAFTLSGNSGSTVNNGMVMFSTTATAGTLAFIRRNDSYNFVNTTAKIIRRIKYNSNISDGRFFCGLTKGNRFLAPTDVSLTTLTNIVGVCKISTSNNLHFICNDNTGTATTIDLGSSYLANNVTDYDFFITIEQLASSYIVTVERVTPSTGATISTTQTFSSDIPDRTTGFVQICTWITNNATASIASYYDGGGVFSFVNQ